MRLKLFKQRPKDGIEAVVRVLGEVVSPLFAVYDVHENHLVMAGEVAGSPQNTLRKYDVGSEGITALRSELEREDRFAVLAYDFSSGSFYIIDAVPKLEITAAIMMSVMTTVLSHKGVINQAPQRTNQKCVPEYEFEDEVRYEENFGVHAVTERNYGRPSEPEHNTTFVEMGNPLEGLRRVIPKNLVTF